MHRKELNKIFGKKRCADIMAKSKLKTKMAKTLNQEEKKDKFAVKDVRQECYEGPSGQGHGPGPGSGPGPTSLRVMMRLLVFFNKGHKNLAHRLVHCASTFSLLELMNVVRPTTIYSAGKLFRIHIVRPTAAPRLHAVRSTDLLDSMQLVWGDTLYVDCSPPPLETALSNSKTASIVS